MGRQDLHGRLKKFAKLNMKVYNRKSSGETNMNAQLVYTNENCVGCNKCITVCSCMGACISTKPDSEGHSRINVDANRCVACGACANACPKGAIAVVHGWFAYADPEICVGCGLCGKSCPVGCITPVLREGVA